MRIELISAQTRHEIAEAINGWMEKNPLVEILFEPRVFFNQFRKKWYCIVWYKA